MTRRAREGLRSASRRFATPRRRFRHRAILRALDQELPVICDMGFAAHADRGDYIGMRATKAFRGAGRGSVVGSLVSYSLRHHRTRSDRASLAVRNLAESRTQIDALISIPILFRTAATKSSNTSAESTAKSASRKSSPSEPSREAGDSRCRPRAWIVHSARPTRSSSSIPRPRGPGFSADSRRSRWSRASRKSARRIPSCSKTHSSSKACCATLQTCGGRGNFRRAARRDGSLYVDKERERAARDHAILR